ncbi:MAG: Hsp70 family protein, partial [Clostridia bacterium]|nr:Hsp70 family protein [Clostridia bacterium]
VDTRNNAEALVYQTEKSLNELGDKITEEEKAPVKEQLEKLKETLKGQDEAAIKADSEELTKRFYAIAEKLYKNAAPQGDPAQGAAQEPQGETVYDADFKPVDEDDKK